MSGCTLRFAKNSPLRTTLVDESTGNIKYKIETPVKIARSVTRIRKFESPTQPPLHWDEDRNSDSGDDDITDGCKKNTSNHEEEEHEAEAEPQETSDEIARIYWKLFSSNRFILRGRITTRREFLPRCGKMKGSFEFTGPDGVQYRWELGAMGMNLPKLITTDENKTVIAEFHRPNYLVNKQKARLEIKPAGMDMLDNIVVTFVFVEHRRRVREAAAYSCGYCLPP